MARPKKAGRPTKITKAITKTIVDAVRRGNYIETAAALAGVSKNTIYEWMRRGAAEGDRLEENPRLKPKIEETPFFIFSDALKKALAQSENDSLMVMDEVARGYEAVETITAEKVNPKTGQIQTLTETKTTWERDWTAMAWRMERRFRKRWGRNLPEDVETEEDSEGLVLVEHSDAD